MLKRILSIGFLALITVSGFSQNRIGTGFVVELYTQHCAACHGPQLKGGAGSSLVDDEWAYGGSPAEISKVISDGLLDKGMLAYKDTLTAEEIQSLAIYILEMGQLARTEGLPDRKVSEGGEFSSQHHGFKLEKVVSLEDDIFWSVSFLPDGAMLLSKFGGDLYVYRDGKLGKPIKGIPNVTVHGQGGLMEVQAHPDFEKNGWIYLSYPEVTSRGDGRDVLYMTKIVRGRIKSGKWVDQEVIFRVPREYHKSARVHFGTRFVFDDGYLYFSIGDRGSMNDAQDITKPNGKVHRIYDDGRIPQDNPFVKEPGAYASIWTYGNRNPQGVDMNPATGEIWATEHGPRGGDELNWIRKGRNYGWPVITYGMNYNGKPISGKTAAPGMEQPVHYWTPSIAVCGIDFYEGDNFPKWKGDLFVTGLASEHVERIKLDGDKIVEHEVVLRGQGRARDISTGPDGNIYVILNIDRSGGPSGVYRIVPNN
ncbi:MAG: PQQ-dependent sugar dehydrogenase [Puniceicoccaceae bacterium]